MVLSKKIESNGRFKSVEVWSYSENEKFVLTALWQDFEEYIELMFPNYSEEVTVLLFEDKSLIVNPSEKHLQHAYGKHRIFKARLTEIVG
jgi:hypothetical protein